MVTFIIERQAATLVQRTAAADSLRWLSADAGTLSL
jgi:hypothetical protein